MKKLFEEAFILNESFVVNPFDSEERNTIINWLNKKNIMWAADVGNNLMVFGDASDIATMEIECDATYMVK